MFSCYTYKADAVVTDRAGYRMCSLAIECVLLLYLQGGRSRHGQGGDSIYAYMHIYTYTLTRIYLHMHIYTYTLTRICTYARIRTNAYTHLRIYAYMHIHICTHTRTYAYTHIHVYTYTHKADAVAANKAGYRMCSLAIECVLLLYLQGGRGRHEQGGL